MTFICSYRGGYKQVLTVTLSPLNFEAGPFKAKEECASFSGNKFEIDEPVLFSGQELTHFPG